GLFWIDWLPLPFAIPFPYAYVIAAVPLFPIFGMYQYSQLAHFEGNPEGYGKASLSHYILPYLHHYVPLLRLYAMLLPVMFIGMPMPPVTGIIPTPLSLTPCLYLFVVPGLFVLFHCMWAPVMYLRDPSRGIKQAVLDSSRVNMANKGQVIILTVYVIVWILLTPVSMATRAAYLQSCLTGLYGKGMLQQYKESQEAKKSKENKTPPGVPVYEPEGSEDTDRQGVIEV
ncbi:hypothetical protein KIPB_004556, partial [Kipferlia bialata]